MSKTALLVGCGSIGKKHLQEMLTKFDSVLVVDISLEALTWATDEGSRVGGALVSVAQSVDEALASAPFDVATIANWGPDHVPTIRALQAVGQKNFVVEKPLADSIADARDILGEVERAGGKLWINLTRRYSGLPSGILRVAAEHGLGDLIGVTVTGGARCLATNGIHYLDLATVLFGSSPVSVTADLESQNINPRHESLAFYEGSVNYNYAGGKRFSCVFLNQSAVTENVRLYWRNAEGEMMPNGDFSLRIRSAAEIETYPSVTRTGYAIDEVFRGNLWLTEGGLSGMTALYDEVVEVAAGASATAGGSAAGATLGGRTAEDLLAALHASELGQRLALPVDAAVVDINKHWSIS
jgi:predicted dehydrogenase